MKDNMYLEPFENIDRLLQVEIRLRGKPPGVIAKLYPYARDSNPISYDTASVFVNQQSMKVGIITGVELLPFLPHGEVDGLPGSVILARALGRLGHDVYVLTTEGCIPVVESLISTLKAPRTEAINVSRISQEDLRILTSETDIGIAIEKIGVNSKGITHTVEGKAFVENGPKYGDDYINALSSHGKVTIGYGDGGNEIGFGKIYEKVRELTPYGKKCQCPCESGKATITATDILWPVNVSNFGAYGTVAAIAILTGDLGIALNPEDHLKALEISIEAGVFDGSTGRPIVAEDGIPAVTASAYVQIIHGIVDATFSNFDRPF
jgi:hypothetical protein